VAESSVAVVLAVLTTRQLVQYLHLPPEAQVDAESYGVGVVFRGHFQAQMWAL
jgi:hypothetical protein